MSARKTAAQVRNSTFAECRPPMKSFARYGIQTVIRKSMRIRRDFQRQRIFTPFHQRALAKRTNRD
jgi:hypothetical protein